MKKTTTLILCLIIILVGCKTEEINKMTGENIVNCDEGIYKDLAEETKLTLYEIGAVHEYDRIEKKDGYCNVYRILKEPIILEGSSVKQITMFNLNLDCLNTLNETMRDSERNITIENNKTVEEAIIYLCENYYDEYY